MKTARAAGAGPGTVVPTEELARAARFESMLENAPTNMMFADRDLVIRYMNPASLETLRTLEDHLPVKADDIVGSSLDIFHTNPAYQRGILASEDNLPRRANINVGPEALDLLVSPIRDKDGDYIGAMATWELVTKKLELEKLADETASDTAAVNKVLQAMAGAASARRGRRIALDTVRDSFGWAYGSYWRVDQSDRTLKFVLESGDAGEEFRAVTLAASFAEGVGLLRPRLAQPGPVLHPGHRRDDRLRPGARRPAGRRRSPASASRSSSRGEVIGTMDFFATETLTRPPAASRPCATSADGLPRDRADPRPRSAGSEAAADTAAVNQVLHAVGAGESADDAAREPSTPCGTPSAGPTGPTGRSTRTTGPQVRPRVRRRRPEFRKVTLAASFPEGVGLSGRAWKTRDLYFTKDIGEMTDCVRAPVAQRVGVKSGVCFPLIVEGEVIGTMDFFATETLDPSRAAASTPSATSANRLLRPRAGPRPDPGAGRRRGPASQRRPIHCRERRLRRPRRN